METFAEALRALRSQRGRSREALGRHAQVAPSYVWDLEQGRRHPSPGTAEALDRALDGAGSLVAAAEADRRQVPGHLGGVPGRSRAAARLMAVTGMDTLEIVTRLQASDVSSSTLDALEITADQLGRDYSHQPPDQLRAEGQAWLGRLTALLDRRLTLTQHRRVLSLAGQVALLVGCVEYDVGRSGPAETTRRAALSLGREAEDPDVIGWAWEMRAWYALTQGQYRAAVAAADAGLAAVGPSRTVAIQLAAHRAKAWARLGDRQEVAGALDQGQALLEAMPYPDDTSSHFVVDPSKWAFYTLDVHRHIGDDAAAETSAREVIREATGGDGTVLRPMRAAEAHITLGVVAAHQRDLDTALAEGRRALAGDRRSLPSLRMTSAELGRVLRETFGDVPAVAEYADQARALTRPA